eukprot:1262443-Alexandrium_andersonii.AAC.1
MSCPSRASVAVASSGCPMQRPASQTPAWTKLCRLVLAVPCCPRPGGAPFASTRPPEVGDGRHACM